MGSSLVPHGNVDFAPLGKKNPRDRVLTTLPRALFLHHKPIIHILHVDNHGGAVAQTRIFPPPRIQATKYSPSLHAANHPLPSPTRGLP